MQDNFKPYGSTASGEVGAGKGNFRTVPVIGVVKDNIDPIRLYDLIHDLLLGNSISSTGDSFTKTSSISSVSGSSLNS